MEQIDGEEDSALTWGDLNGTRVNPRKPACESRLNVQKSAEVIVRLLLQQQTEGLNMK